MTLIPANAGDRRGWATDITAAFAAQGIEPSDENLCSVLAVTEQESTFGPTRRCRGCRRSHGRRSIAVPIRCTSRTFGAHRVEDLVVERAELQRAVG